MGWLIEALANVFLELLGDLMAWTVNLITTLSLDIGMDAVTMPDGTTKQAVTPSLGSLINPMAARGNLLESTFPQAASFTQLFLFLALGIVFFMTASKLVVAMGGPFTRSEEPGTIVIRSLIATVGTVYSFSIFVLFETLFNSIYTRFMNKYTEITKDVNNYSLLTNGDATVNSDTAVSGAESFRITYGGGNGATAAEDAYEMFGKDLINEYEFGTGLAVTIITIVLFAILLVAFLKLVLEIYERYVMLGVLFYTSPLAFSTIVSKQMNVFGSWVQMVISEFVVMCSNLFFTGVFISAWHNILATEKDYLFENPADFITRMFLMIAWLMIGQQFDQHLKALGLSTAQTGTQLGSQVMTGLGTAAAMGSMAWGTLKKGAGTATNVATGQTKVQRSLAQGTGPLGSLANGMKDFPSMSKNDADNFLSSISTGEGKAAKALDKMDADSRSQRLLGAAQASMGESNFQSALYKQTGGTLGDINNDSIRFQDGVLSGQTLEGKPFEMRHDSMAGPREVNTAAVGNGWSMPVSKEMAEGMAEQYAHSISGNDVNYSVNPDNPARLSVQAGEFYTRDADRIVPGLDENLPYWDPKTKA